MRYILANLAKAELANDIDSSQASIVLTNISTSLNNALGQVDSQNLMLLTIATKDGSSIEVVEVTAWDSGTSTITVNRGQENTSGQSFSAGTAVELRITSALVQNRSGSPYVADYGDVPTDPPGVEASTCVAIGAGCYAGKSDSQGTFSPYTFAAGYKATAYHSRAVAIGGNVSAKREGSVALGAYCDSYGRYMCVGYKSKAFFGHAVGAGATGISYWGFHLGCYPWAGSLASYQSVVLPMRTKTSSDVPSSPWYGLQVGEGYSAVMVYGVAVAMSSHYKTTTGWKFEVLVERMGTSPQIVGKNISKPFYTETSDSRALDFVISGNALMPEFVGDPNYTTYFQTTMVASQLLGAYNTGE